MSMMSTVSFVYHNMKSWTLFLQLVLISMATADGPKERFLVTLSTSTVNVGTTSSYTTTPTTYCLTNSDPITACRKRRGIEEHNFIAKRDADSISPTGTFAIEPSRPAQMQSPTRNQNRAPAVQSSKDMVEVKIAGLDHVCQARQLNQIVSWDPSLSITVITTTSSTTTTTTTSTAPAVTRRITLNCTPQGFTYQLC